MVLVVTGVCDGRRRSVWSMMECAAPRILQKCQLTTSTQLLENGRMTVGELSVYTVFQKSDAKIQITITTAYLIRIKYPLSSFNYHLSDVNVANFNKIHRIVSEQELF